MAQITYFDGHGFADIGRMLMTVAGIEVSSSLNRYQYVGYTVAL